jgi:heme exporter protein CcmD
MGSYAFYVWASYAAAAVVLIFNVLAARRRDKTVRRELENVARLNRSESE